MSDTVYGHCAPLYSERGFWPRPVKPGTKQAAVPGWQNPDSEIPKGTRDGWLRKFADFGIGLTMGSPLPDGTTLGAVDIDRDEYVGLGEALLGEIVCGRFGSKGIVIFVRVSGPAKSRDFKVRRGSEGKGDKVAEVLFKRKFCVIPPTIHPGTLAPYRWIGTSLLEVDVNRLPLVIT